MVCRLESGNEALYGKSNYHYYEEAGQKSTNAGWRANVRVPDNFFLDNRFGDLHGHYSCCQQTNGFDYLLRCGLSQTIENGFSAHFCGYCYQHQAGDSKQQRY